jgi:hypothetical protein
MIQVKVNLQKYYTHKAGKSQLFLIRLTEIEKK